MTEVTSEPRIRMRHIRAARLCARGARAWYAQYDLSWNEMLTHGTPASVLEATGDPLAQRVIEHARADHGR